MCSNNKNGNYDEPMTKGQFEKIIEGNNTVKYNELKNRLMLAESNELATIAVNKHLSKKLAESNNQIKILKDALETISNANTCEKITDGLHNKYNNYADGWFGVIEYAKKILKDIE